MSKKNEIIKAGILTALVAFVIMSAFAVVGVAQDGRIAISAYAFRSQESGSGQGGSGSGPGGVVIYGGH